MEFDEVHSGINFSLSYLRVTSEAKDAQLHGVGKWSIWSFRSRNDIRECISNPPGASSMHASIVFFQNILLGGSVYAPNLEL